MHTHKLPGSLSKEEEIKRMIRVNQAGEYGAMRIYAGQLAVLGNTESGEIIRHMAEQEKQHLDYFNQEIPKRKVRPTALQPLWHVAGWLLGAGTAMIGEKAAMACTVAVESVIDEHYKKQIDVLQDEEQELKNHIEKFRAEELEHHGTGLANGAEQSPLYDVLTSVIRMQTKMAIWLSTRF